MAETLTKYQKYISDFHAFEGSLPGSAPLWLTELRKQAISSFSVLGFPTARRGNERWKYTNVAPIANASFDYPIQPSPSELKASVLKSSAPWNDGWINLVFVNGRYSQTLSTPSPWSKDSVVGNMADVVAADGDLLEKHLSNRASFKDDGFIALNTAFLRDGAFVHLPRGQSLPAPLHLLFITTDSEQPSVSFPRALIVADSNTRLTIIESYIGLTGARYFTDAVTEIVLGEGAQVEHYRLLQEGQQAFHVGVTRVYQGQDSSFTSAAFARGAALGRSDLDVLLDAPGASCYLRGLYMTSGTQHIDNLINIDHAKPHGTSRLNYKGILDGKSRAVFGGTVLVRPGAIKTDAKQSDKNLILSEEAEADSKPALFIYADDVKCGHGATAGHIDDNAILYMRSRGIPLEQARALLIHGFASEIIDTVQIEHLRTYLNRLFLGHLPSFEYGREA